MYEVILDLVYFVCFASQNTILRHPLRGCHLLCQRRLIACGRDGGLAPLIGAPHQIVGGNAIEVSQRDQRFDIWFIVFTLIELIASDTDIQILTQFF